MKVTEPNIDFKILIDDSFINLKSEEEIEHIENKNILSLINDFADGKWRF